jgi:SPP1 family predicted phage head-tail adaptor
LNCGQLKRRVALQRPASGQDALGQPLTGFETVATVWGDVRQPSGLESVRAGAEVSLVKASIRIRLRTDVAPGWRAAVDGVQHEVRAVLLDIGHRAYTDLVCEVVR